MDDSKIVFSITAAQLRVLRVIAKKGSARELYRKARRDPAESLRHKGLIENPVDKPWGTWDVTPFGAACIAGLKKIDTSALT